MELIWLLTVIALLAQHSIADYTKTTTSGTWTDMRNVCNLATPTIKYSAEELTADFGTDIELYNGEKLWVGYIEDLEIYGFYGCINQQYLTDRYALGDRYAVEKKAAVGLCYSACRNTTSFGVMENEDKKALCYCIDYSNQNNLMYARTHLTSCNSSGDEGFAFGRGQFLAIYERVSTNLSTELKELDTWNDKQRKCLRYFNPSEHRFQWFTCFDYHNVLCANSSRQASFLEASYPWKRAMDYCFEKSSFPFAYQSSRLSSNLTLQYWLANTRSMTITKDIGRSAPIFMKYGYVERNGDKLNLKFGKQDGDYKGLCQNGTADANQTLDGSTDESKGPIGVYVGIAFAIVSVVVAVVISLIIKRKRCASPEKIDNTRRNLTYESNTQPNQNMNVHRPDSAEVHHEIQDVTKSTNEGYDTIPDGYLQKSTQNCNTEVDYFVLEKHDNADYEFAKEVIGETEHVYDRKSINTTMAVTDDYDHIGEGNSAPKQSLEDQPYYTTSHVKQKYQDPTYDHTGDYTAYNHTCKQKSYGHNGNHTTYDHTGDNADYDHTGDHKTCDHTGKNVDYDHIGDHTTCDHTGENADYDHTGDHTTYDHTGDHNSYDQTGDNTNYDHIGHHANYDHAGDRSANDYTEDDSDKTDLKL